MSTPILLPISFLEDVIADRPTAGPGYKGLFFYATDTEAWSFCDGTVWIDLGGGGGGTLSAATEYFQTESITVPADTQTFLDFTHLSGATLLDYSNPSDPTIITDGAYTLAARMVLDNNYSGAFGSFVLACEESQVGGPFPLDFRMNSDGYQAGIPMFWAVGDDIAAWFTHDAGSDVTINFFNGSITLWTVS